MVMKCTIQCSLITQRVCMMKVCRCMVTYIILKMYNNESLSHMMIDICAMNVKIALYSGMVVSNSMMVIVSDNTMVSNSIKKIGGKGMPKDLILNGVSEAKGNDPIPKGLSTRRVTITWMSNHWDYNHFTLDS